MGSSVSAANIKTPGTYPRTEFIGHDHKWSYDSLTGMVTYRDLRFYLGKAMYGNEGLPADWTLMTTEERRERLYLNARRDLVVGE